MSWGTSEKKYNYNDLSILTFKIVFFLFILLINCPLEYIESIYQRSVKF